MYTTFNQIQNDQLKEPMFFGQEVNVSRYDQQKFQTFEKLIELQLGFFWRPEEIALDTDRKDFEELPEHEKHIFLSNLKYQILLDSVQGRSPNIAFLPVVSLPEVETWIETWSFSETIHSRSYTHIIRNILPDPSVVFDDIVVNEKIIVRAKAVTEDYDLLIDMVQKYQQGISEQYGITLRDIKKQLFKTMIVVNILEAVRFYVSFACSFAFAERKKMEGNAKIIKLIARDEALHLAGTQQIIRIWASGQDDPEMKEIYEEIKKSGLIYDLFMEAADQEKDWTKYLFKDGSMIGLNADILDNYVEYITNERLKALGFSAVYQVSNNPLPWMDSWLSSDEVQVAPQEVEVSSYLTGATDADLVDNQFKGYKL